jgi:hypothetical protein
VPPANPQAAVVVREVARQVVRVGGDSPAIAVRELAAPQVLSLGVVGPQGPPGAPGAGGSTYTHIQSTDAAVWTVNHNLGREPAGVEVLTPGGVRVWGGVLHTSVNQLVVTFASPQQGRVRCI